MLQIGLSSSISLSVGLEIIHDSILTFDNLARGVRVRVRRGDGTEQTEEIDCAGKSERQNGKQRKRRDTERNREQ
jgi:hypothetical protein